MTPAGTRLLCFDTSTERSAIALAAGDRTLVFEGEGGAQASAQLLPRSLELLARAGCAIDELDAIAFGTGPGAFTGLRTSCAVAQGLAFGAGKPVLAIDSLMIVAESTRGAVGTRVWVAMDARMDEIYAARYRAEGDGWVVESAPALYALADFQRALEGAGAASIAGSALDAFGERLATGSLRRSACGSRAEALARLARVAWREQRCCDAADALPVYLRDRVAQTVAERAAALQTAR